MTKPPFTSPQTIDTLIFTKLFLPQCKFWQEFQIRLRDSKEIAHGVSAIICNNSPYLWERVQYMNKHIDKRHNSNQPETQYSLTLKMMMCDSSAQPSTPLVRFPHYSHKHHNLPLAMTAHGTTYRTFYETPVH